MDIFKWLDETEQPQIPQPTCKRKHSQKQPKSDSSLLKPLSPQAPSVQQEVRHHSAGNAPAASPSGYSSSSCYVRKPRRKTRPERYEPNAPKRSRQKNKPSKARHKSRQKHGQGPGQLIQSFKAKNVSGHRLTLRPPELGLFNKGRTSIAARGRGLPDLVFSEMKFLQKHDEPKLLPQSEVPRKKRKTDHTHTKDEEISSFFVSRQHALVRQPEDKPSSHSGVAGTKRRHRDRSPITHTVEPTIELGGRESCLDVEGWEARCESTGHVSWSESVQTRSIIPICVQPGDGTCRDRHDSGRHGHPRSTTNRDESLLKLFRLSSIAKQITDSTNERFHVSSLALSQSGISRSQSCPQHSSSPRQLNLVDRPGKHQSTERAYSSSSMPPVVPCMLNVKLGEGLSASRSNHAESQTPPKVGRETHAASQHKRLNDDEKCCEDDLRTSSDLGKVLQVCKESMHDQDWAAPTPKRNRYMLEPTFSIQPIRRQQRPSSHTSTRRIPTVRFAELPCAYQAQTSFNNNPGIYEQQEPGQYPTWEASGAERIDDYPWGLEEEYMDVNSVLDYDGQDYGWDDMDDLLGASMSHGHGEPEDMCMARNPFRMDNASADARTGNDVVAAGFWRPNKLY